MASDEDAVPEGDPSSTTGLLLERLQAWKHMVSYLEEYIKAVGKGQHAEAKEQEKILKVSSPYLVATWIKLTRAFGTDGLTTLEARAPF